MNSYKVLSQTWMSDKNVEHINSNKSLFIRFDNKDPSWQAKFLEIE